jgi:hypothetical protein
MSNLEETYKLNDFYEGNKISKCNQEIMTEYLLQVAREVRSQASVKNNVEFMKFLVTHIKTDLDKLRTYALVGSRYRFLITFLIS